MHVVAHHSLQELQHLRDHASRPALVLKLQAVRLAREGWVVRRIGEALGRSYRTIQQWVGAYNARGLDGLKDRRSSNHRYLTAEEEKQLRTHAEDPHAGLRHAADLIPYLEEHFGATYSLSGLYELLRRLGYSWLMPRPRHEKNDPAEVEAFKKTPRRWSNASPTDTPAKRSRSGSRTRHASASKAR